MRTLLVFESLFGNTKTIAESIVDGIGPASGVTVVNAGESDPPEVAGFDLLVVGAPTHVLGLPRPSTRDQEHSPRSAASTGVREWLEGLPATRSGPPAAAFDTRLAKPRWLTGSAARRAARRLRGLGFRVVATEDFLVDGTTGPLHEGEIERARAWGARLAEHVGAPRG